MILKHDKNVAIAFASQTEYQHSLDDITHAAGTTVHRFVSPVDLGTTINKPRIIYCDENTIKARNGASLGGNAEREISPVCQAN